MREQGGERGPRQCEGCCLDKVNKEKINKKKEGGDNRKL